MDYREIKLIAKRGELHLVLNHNRSVEYWCEVYFKTNQTYTLAGAGSEGKLYNALLTALKPTGEPRQQYVLKGITSYIAVILSGPHATINIEELDNSIFRLHIVDKNGNFGPFIDLTEEERGRWIELLENL